MALNVPNVSEAEMLKRIFQDKENCVLHLYTNDYTPVNVTTHSNFTEATGNGYANITLTNSAWSITGGGGDPTFCNYAQQTFTFTGALGNVFGYYVTNANNNMLLYAERFSDAPYNIQNNGDQIKVTLSIQLE